MDKLTAYHEAGHILMAYILDYSVEKAEIFQNGDGETRINYGNEMIHAAVAMNINQAHQVFQEDTIGNGICEKMLHLLIAGPIAEMIYKDKPSYNQKVKVKLSDTDKTRIENICNLKNFSLEEFIKKDCKLFMADEIWDVIEKLSQGLLSAKNYTLEKNDIESILKNSKYAKYL